MARFQNCVMLFKIAARFPNIWALGDIWYQLHGKQNPKRPRFWLVLSLSPTPYIIHWSRWQLFCVEKGLKLKQTAIFC